MFERMRETWTEAMEPLVLKMGNLNPNILTWTSLSSPSEPSVSSRALASTVTARW